MGHLTLKMLSIIASGLMIFGLARADASSQKQREEPDQDQAEDSDSETSKKEKSEEKFRAEQSIHRALRDQERAQAKQNLPKPPAPKK